MVTDSEGVSCSRWSTALRWPVTSIVSSEKSSNVLLGDDAEELLDGFLLVDVIVAVPRQLLHQGGETESRR